MPNFTSSDPSSAFDPFSIKSLFPPASSDAMQSATQMYQLWFQSWLTANAETTRFLAHRLQQDMRFPMSLAECHSPQAIAEKQMEFWNTMAKDYARQAEKMQAIFTDSFRAYDRSSTLNWPEPTTGRGRSRTRMQNA
ncbi:MAG: phasin family protein [Filomicrobium sp.]